MTPSAEAEPRVTFMLVMATGAIETPPAPASYEMVESFFSYDVAEAA
jgi:hypothetical protein